MKYKFVSYEKDIFHFFFNNEKYKKAITFNPIYNECSYDEIKLLIFSQIPNITKVDILELLELCVLYRFWSPRIEGDDIMIRTYYIDKLDDDLDINLPKLSYIGEYINIIGQLFLAGYIDFGSYCDEDVNKIDYPTNLSYYKEDKYQTWIYFRDNFFYKNKFVRYLDEMDICDEQEQYLLFEDTSWDTPRYWSQYNIWVAQTPKGTKYFDKILAPRFYDKYKDLSVEIDDKGNVIKWIGEINR